MKAFAIAFIFILISSLISSAQVQEPSQIIKKEGQFVFTDGASYFLFKKDGTFQSGPIGMSGRTIEGHWKLDPPSLFIIEGQWSWLNGGSQKDDFRKMTLGLSIAESSSAQKIPAIDAAKPVKVYKCYFEIEELVKTPRSKQEGVPLQPDVRVTPLGVPSQPRKVSRETKNG